MKNETHARSLELWKREGRHVQVLQPFMDSVIVGGEGSWLVDADGGRILDLAAGQFCSILGHNHPRFVARMQEQVGRLLHLGDQYVSPEVMAACARLVGVAPGKLHKAILLSTGSEANECAMRMAKAATDRTGMFAFSRGYYGISLATHNLSSISDHPRKHDFQPAPVGQHKLLTPSCRHCPVGKEHAECDTSCLDASLELIGGQIENVAAVIVEPVLSAGGMIFPSVEYMQRLRAETQRAGALFIVDEAQTGFGRCGRWFDVDTYGIEPDMMVVSKTAGNGYPVAAVLLSEAVSRRLEARFFTHLSSHQNDPLAAAAVLAVIDIVEQENLVERSRTTGEYFMQALTQLQARHPSIVDVRGRGLMIGVELAASGDDAGTLAFKVAMLCEQRGVHLTYTYFEPVLRIIPPLVLTHADVDHAVKVLDEALGAVESGRVRSGDLVPANAASHDFVKGMVDPSPTALLRKAWRTSPEHWARKLRQMRSRA